MSMQDYIKARALIEKAGSGDFEGAKPENLVVKAETALGIQFPPTYRRFLLELGCGGINGIEIFGVIDGDFEHSSVPDAIWLTLKERATIHLNPSYVIVEDGGDGTSCAIDLSQKGENGESPVIRLTVEGEPFEAVADSFGTFLLSAAKNVR